MCILWQKEEDSEGFQKSLTFFYVVFACLTLTHFWSRIVTSSTESDSPTAPVLFLLEPIPIPQAP